VRCLWTPSSQASNQLWWKDKKEIKWEEKIDNGGY